jgi:hypothetical protein
MRAFKDVVEQVGRKEPLYKGVIVPDISPALELEMTYTPTHSDAVSDWRRL